MVDYEEIETMRTMKGCSHILTKQDCERLKFGNPGSCVDLLIQEKSGLAIGEWQGRVLDLGTTNAMLPPLYFKDITSKVLFEIKQVSESHYRYDSKISQVAAYLENYRSEVFTGNDRPSGILEQMAKAVLEKSRTIPMAVKWIQLDEAPPESGCHSLSQFLLDIAYPTQTLLRID